jgi:Fic family protein
MPITPHNLRMENGDKTYTWQLPDWPHFWFDAASLAAVLARVHQAQGRLLGRMENLGFRLRNEATLQAATDDVVKSSEIEGEHLNRETVRSSVARRLGIDLKVTAKADRHIEGIVEMMLDATRRFAKPLTPERLFGWYAALFPTGYSGFSKIQTGGWRDDAAGPMQVVSGPMGREKVHYQAPPAERLEKEMRTFLRWFDAQQDLDLVIKAGLAHIWFVTIHPFDDGNGKIARCVCDMALARSEQSSQRFYSLSAQIQQELKDYYELLERTQKGGLDVTEWLDWFLGCVERALENSELSAIIAKAEFWHRWAGTPLNERQIKIINRLLDGFEGKLTSSKWASITKCSPDVALRDANDLIARGLLKRSEAGGRSTNYDLQRE